jgi:hypothetical protein
MTTLDAARPARRWPLILIASPAAVAVWSGWVGLGGMCGFGVVHPLPGIMDSFTINTAITLPVGVEAYGAYALGAWMTPGTPPAARTFAKRSAIGALCLGMTGQVIYHLLAASHAVSAPPPVVVLVSCLPVLVLGFGAALTHLLRTGLADRRTADSGQAVTVESALSAPLVTASPDTGHRTPEVGAPDSGQVPTGQPAPDNRVGAPDNAHRTADSAQVGAPTGQADTAQVGAALTSGNDAADRTRRFVADHSDMSQVAVAAALGISPRTVRRHLSALGVVGAPPTGQRTADTEEEDTGQGTAPSAQEDSAQEDTGHDRPAVTVLPLDRIEETG